MMKQVWSALMAVVVAFAVITIAIEAIKPYLPVIGFVLTAALAFYFFRFLSRRRRL